METLVNYKFDIVHKRYSCAIKKNMYGFHQKVLGLQEYKEVNPRNIVWNFLKYAIYMLAIHYAATETWKLLHQNAICDNM